MTILFFFLAHWYLSLFAQTFFLHRYAAHQMFIMNMFWEKLFYFSTWLFQGSSFLSPKAYGIMHRLHHAYADTEKDPHSLMYSKNLLDMMKKTLFVYLSVLNNTKDMEDKFKKGVPYWASFERIAGCWFVRMGWGVLYLLFYLQYSNYWWMFFLFPIHFLMGPIHGAIINWYAHKYGYVSFKLADTAKNLLPIDILMMGESYHNNHHKFGGRANFGVKWHEFDPTYLIIFIFNLVGIIHIKKDNDLKFM